MRISPRNSGIFVVSLLMGTIYAVLIGLLTGPLRTALIAWPISVGLFWFIFWRFNVLRFVGFIVMLPVSVLGFEIFWSASNPGMQADKYLALDRSHYIPGLRVRNPQTNETDHALAGSASREILIGSDGFRADPNTGQGNPDRCQFVLIGDSMIYGTGLPYPFTLGPVLAGMGVRVCVFGVTGNSPVDYLATLKYVAARIDPEAYVAFYLYAYNDFVSLNKYFTRGFLTLSDEFQTLFRWADYFDNWRKATYTHSLLRVKQVHQHASLSQYDVGKGEPIRILYSHDPATYVQPKPLNERHRVALRFFLKNLANVVRGRYWHIFIIIHPDDAEIYANLARRSRVFVDLDPRRADGLRMCREFSFDCEDMSRYLYERLMAEGKNPYLDDDRHFSAFGTRIVAEHFLALTRQAGEEDRGSFESPIRRIQSRITTEEWE